MELERLRKLARQAYEFENEIDTKHMKIPEPDHLDHSNPHTFEIADLRKLITKVGINKRNYWVYRHYQQELLIIPYQC